MKLANYFGVSLDFLVYGDDSRRNEDQKAFTNETIFAGLFDELDEAQQGFIIAAMKGIIENYEKPED